MFHERERERYTFSLINTVCSNCDYLNRQNAKCVHFVFIAFMTQYCIIDDMGESEIKRSNGTLCVRTAGRERIVTFLLPCITAMYDSLSRDADHLGISIEDIAIITSERSFVRKQKKNSETCIFCIVTVIKGTRFSRSRKSAR